jgi:hypothetical protein
MCRQHNPERQQDPPHDNSAAARGERVLCQLLGWAGGDDRLARVRIIHSTVPLYRTGMVGLVQRQRLIPLRPRRADAC